jgi:hypothetical protein
MYLRAFLVWRVLVLLAIANGGVREVVLTPRLGPRAGHIISTISLSMIILLVAWLTVRWIAPPDSRQALMLGVGWACLTLSFEFLAGHYWFHHSWSELLADYSLRRGRIWPLVLVAAALAPLIAAKLPNILSS